MAGTPHKASFGNGWETPGKQQKSQKGHIIGVQCSFSHLHTHPIQRLRFSCETLKRKTIFSIRLEDYPEYGRLKHVTAVKVLVTIHMNKGESVGLPFFVFSLLSSLSRLTAQSQSQQIWG